MNDNFLATTLAPKIFRFDDVDQFRSSVRNLNVDFTPLVRKISAEQTILHLPGCDVNFTKSFPRIYDVQLRSNCTAVGFSMDDGVPIRFNGVEPDRSVIVIGRAGAAYNAVEKTPRIFASIIFTSDIGDRGWPQTGLNFKMFETSVSAQHSLRSLVLHALSVTSQPVEPFEVSTTAAAIKESLSPRSMRRSRTWCPRHGRRAQIRHGNSRCSWTCRRHWPAALEARFIVGNSHGRSVSPCAPCTMRCNDIGG